MPRALNEAEWAHMHINGYAILRRRYLLYHHVARVLFQGLLSLVELSSVADLFMAVKECMWQYTLVFSFCIRQAMNVEVGWNATAYSFNCIFSNETA